MYREEQEEYNVQHQEQSTSDNNICTQHQTSTTRTTSLKRKKIKFALKQATKAQRGSRNITQLFL
jgi:hypothetical protein